MGLVFLEPAGLVDAVRQRQMAALRAQMKVVDEAIRDQFEAEAPRLTGEFAASLVTRVGGAETPDSSALDAWVPGTPALVGSPHPGARRLVYGWSRQARFGWTSLVLAKAIAEAQRRLA